MAVKKILITGAGGLVAFHLIPALKDVLQVHATTHRELPEMHSNVSYHPIDFAAPWSTEVLPPRIDAVVHLAQSSRYRDFPDQALDIQQVNVDATARLLDYARRAGAASFIFPSTGGLYGGRDKPYTEVCRILPLDNLNYHFASKLCGEALALCYTTVMRVSVLRPFFIYGRGQRRSMLIPRLVDSVREGRSITLQGTDGIRINPVHVDDAVYLIKACLERSFSGIINLAGPEALTLKHIAEVIGAKLGISPIFEHAPGDPSDLIGDNTLMRSMLDQPLIPFEQGVADVI